MSLDYDFDAHIEDRPVYKMSVYTDKEGYVIIGFDRKKAIYSILKLKKNLVNSHNGVTLNDVVVEDTHLKTEEQITEYLRSREDQIKFVCKGYAILGFIKLLQGYYLLLVSDATAIAKMGNHKIFKVNHVSYIPLFMTSALSKNKSKENKYLQYLKSFDLSTGFYFSDTYDLTNTFQTNVVSLINDEKAEFPFRAYNSLPCDPIRTHNEYFMWNYFIIEEFFKLLKNKRWVTCFIYGYIEQIKVQKLLFQYQIVLISRRARHHAGTRYLTRGLNAFGFVGNFVETEQIVIDLNKGALGNPLCSSYVQVRGSAPIYWFQETKVVTPKPPINANPSADIYFEATKKHFADLYSFYGPNIFALNLVKKKEGTKREGFLTEGFQQSIDQINLHVPDDIKVIYYHQDMKALLKKDKEEFLHLTNNFGLVCLSKIGYFCASMERGNKRPNPLTFQTGVIRSNCVDCLDRTNTFQQLLGEAVLALQIGKLQEYDGKDSSADAALDDSVLKYFREMFCRMGDIISLQYGGSIAHKTDFGYHTKKNIELITSIKRYYSNTFTDQYKQSAINLFLGIHKPNVDQSPIWESTVPIIWAPDFEGLSRIVGSPTWYKAPLEVFFNSIKIHNNPEAVYQALSQPPVVKLDPKNSYVESIQGDFSLHMSGSRRPSILGDFDTMSMKSSSQRVDPFVRIDKMRNYSDWHIDLAAEVSLRNVNNVSDYQQPPSPSDSKSLFFHKKFAADVTKAVALSEADSELLMNENEKLLLPSKEEIDKDDHDHDNLSSLSKSFLSEKNVTLVSKKFKKVYHQRLIVVNKDEENEEKGTRNRRNSDTGEGLNGKRTMTTGRKIAYPEDQPLFEEYCTFFKKNTDDMFNDKALKNQLLEEMKLGFHFEDMEDKFSGYLDIDSKLVVSEKFTNRIRDYISVDPVKEIAERAMEYKELQKGNGELPKGVRFLKNTSEENYQTSKKTHNLPVLKNILTGLYPNLQKPNIMKA